MLHYIFSSLFLVTITQAIDDTPFSNFTWQLDRVKGHCVKPNPLTFVADKKKYEGRWYGQQVSYKEDQVKTLSCPHWDTFFDKDIMHDFYYVNENEQPELVVVKEEPLQGRRGLYTNDIGPNPAYQNVFTTLFFIHPTGKFQVRYYVQCFDDGTESRDAEVGYRRIEFASEEITKQEVQRVLNILKKRVGEFAVRNIAHEKCNYQPKMEDPYN